MQKTNGEFIALVADKMLLERAKHPAKFINFILRVALAKPK